MEFWDNFSKTVSDAADYTVKEAGKLTGIAKLKYKLASARARLDTLFADMGRIKYDELKGTADSGVEPYGDLTAKIDALKIEIEKCENELAKLKNVRLCVACRSVIGIDMAFCPRCGAKQPEPEEPKDGCGCGCCDDNDDECDCDCNDDDCKCDDDSCDCGCDSDKTEEPKSGSDDQNQ